MNPIETASPLHKQMITWRHWLHQHPELSFKEIKTSDYIAQVLTELGVPFERGLAETGIVATIKGTQDGDHIGLRADMDALPILEANDFAHKSLHEGHMHGCGHDGHSTMLLGAAAYLINNNDFKGTVHCIFQPAEEGDAGAKVMIDEGLFEKYPCKEVYGMHNWPGLAAGEFAIHNTAVMAAVRTFDIIVTGHGGHAAMPDNVIDPIVASAQLITALQSIVSRNMSPLESSVLSITKINAGHAHNVIPDQVHIAGTLRYYHQADGDMVLSRINDVIQGVCSGMGVKGEFKLLDHYPATINTPEHANYAAQAASDVVGADKVHRDMHPSMAAEDFGYMLEELPGAYIWIGNGEGEGGCMLHNAHYDFNDDVSALGASYWVKLVQQRLA
ncbi:amidohydrolase [Leucothrix sargassi]|nr:amidohydrolase [Leucothrix sargassi]